MIIQFIPRKYGKTSNYFHFWVDFYLPYLVNVIKYPKCQVFGISDGFWPKIDPDVKFTTCKDFIVIKGYNPLYFKWNDDILQAIQSYKKKCISRNTTGPLKQIFIERLSDKRHIKNSNAVYNMLQSIFPKMIKINLEIMSFEDQLDLFSNASVVIGQHGAGLTNLMWAPKHTFVIEIDKNLGRLHFSNMCSYLGQKHFKFGAVKSQMITIAQKRKAECFNVDLLEFKKFITTKLNEHYLSPTI